jgi:hypothetical protein
VICFRCCRFHMALQGARECGGRCQRKKAAHAGAWAVAGFVACLLLVWAIDGCGSSGCGGGAEMEQVLGQFNLSWSQLQALVALLSSSQQVLLLICSHSDQLYVCSGCCGHSVLMVTTNGIGRMLIGLQSHRFEQGSCIEACDHL